MDQDNIISFDQLVLQQALKAEQVKKRAGLAQKANDPINAEKLERQAEILNKHAAGLYKGTDAGRKNSKTS